MKLVVFITHHFCGEFINTLFKVNASIMNVVDYKIIVLFDNQHNDKYDNVLEKSLKNIEIIKISKINTSYDDKGHSLYIHYFKRNREEIRKYEYIWIIENDVYYPNSFLEFTKIHDIYNHDLLVSEYGLRSPAWPWVKTLKGFKHTQQIGVLAVILRFSQKLLLKLINTIDNCYFGFFEAILPHICIENKLSIQQFLPETCGILTTNSRFPLLAFIQKDIQENKRNFIENKIYHPIKL